jgi:hypothetical protein
MTRSRRRSGQGALIGGAILIVVGGVFLLRNAGLIPLTWDLWWPLILVGIGLAIILGTVLGGTRGGGGRDQAWASGGGAWSTGGAGTSPGTSDDGLTRVSVPAEGAARLELSLRVGAGRYRLRGGSAVLVEASASEPTIHHGVDRAGDLARVRLSTSLNMLAWAWPRGLEWTIGVASGLPTALEIQAGAGSFDLDLSDVAIASASMSIGAAELRVTLPRPHGDVPVRVEGGAASFTFAIPAGVEARIRSTGLVTTSGPSETPGYATAVDRVTVTVTGGAASVRVIPAG